MGLAAALGGGLADQAQHAELMAAQVRDAARELRVQNAASRRTLDLIAHDGDTLAQEIADLQVGITADRVMSEVAADCLDCLEEAAARARKAAGDPDAQRHAAILHDALRTYTLRYTMRAEREVHESLLGGAATVPPLETVAAASGLGDNVELF